MPVHQQPRWAQLRALSDEVDAASTLLRHGLAILDSYRYASRDADAVFVCLAGGTEKLAKLSLGLRALDADGSWLPRRVMRETYGHDIVVLDGAVRQIISEGRDRSTAPGYIQQLLKDAGDDLSLDLVLRTLAQYARRGRFYNLDLLADSAQPEPSPAQLWEDLHQQLLDERPDLRTALAEGDWETGRKSLNQLIAGSLWRWCELVRRAWITGAVGQQAKQWAAQLDFGRQPAP
jgi:hypothetical protein